MEITIDRVEYEFLVRESERLAVIIRMLEKSKYVSTDDIKAVLDIQQTEGETNVQN